MPENAESKPSSSDLITRMTNRMASIRHQMEQGGYLDGRVIQPSDPFFAILRDSIEESARDIDSTRESMQGMDQEDPTVKLVAFVLHQFEYYIRKIQSNLQIIETSQQTGLLN